MIARLVLLTLIVTLAGCGKDPGPAPQPVPAPPSVPPGPPPVNEFQGIELEKETADVRQSFLARANHERCPCASGKSLAQCRKDGCARALEKGQEILEAMGQR